MAPTDVSRPAGEQGAPATDGVDGKPWWKKWWGITLIVLGLLVVISIATGDDTLDDVDEESTAAEDPDADGSDTPDPADVEEEQEQIAEEEAEDEPVEVEPEPEPEPEPFEPVVISGAGDDVVDVQTFEMPMVATLEHDGGGNFAVWAYDDTGGQDLMVNTIGSYAGTRPLNFTGDVTEFEITASGPWSITITPLLDQPTLRATSSGVGDQVLFADDSGRLTLSHDGSGNFAVRAYGNTTTLLVNEIGSYQGTVRMPDAIALEIIADGNWTAELG